MQIITPPLRSRKMLHGGKIYKELKKLMMSRLFFTWIVMFSMPMLAVQDPTPYLLEESHALKPILDNIFKKNIAIQSDDELIKARFSIISPRPEGMRVVSHPKLKGYLLKLFPFQEQKDDSRDITWAVERCKSARTLRNLVAENDMKYFAIPNKWIYLLPNHKKLKAEGYKNYAILVVDDMKITSVSESKKAWKNVDSKEAIDELYSILTIGSSSKLAENIPYSRSYKKFTCIDTERPRKKPPSATVKAYLSPTMAAYWEELMNVH